MTFGSHRSLRQNSYLSLLSLGVKEFVGGKNNGFPFCFQHRTALLRSLGLLSYPGAQKRNAPSPSDMGRVTFMISRHGQSDIYDLTFSMGYPVRSAGYMFCYNRSMIHLASVFSGVFFGREEEDFDLTQGNFCIMVYLPSMNKGKHGVAGQKSAHTASIPLTIRKVCSAGLSLSGCISAPAKLQGPCQRWIFE